MGLFSKLFGSKPGGKAKQDGAYYQTLTESCPNFAPFTGTVYEQELTRAAIDRFAMACSKLKPECAGESKPHIAKMIRTRPNPQMTWSTFMTRLATIHEVDCMAYIVPIFSRDMSRVTGVFPLKCDYAEILEYAGEPWIRFSFPTGQDAAIELKYVGLLARYPYNSDYFSEPHCINSTMDLIHAQKSALKQAIKNGATIRWIGAVSGRVHEDDLKAKRKRFVEDNFGEDNEGGLLVYDGTFTNVKQVEPQSYVIDEKEMARIEANVFYYFGTNKEILTNSFDEKQWAAYYEGRVEPFAVRVGEALTNMLFTPIEQMHGNSVMFSSNRLQYATTADKNRIITNMVDRGVMCVEQAEEILQLSHVDNGTYVIRGEYVDVNSLKAAKKEPEPDAEPDPEPNDPDNGGENA